MHRIKYCSRNKWLDKLNYYSILKIYALFNFHLGVTDMFPVISYTPELRQEYCRRVWNVTIREDWTAINYWGRDIKRFELSLFR
jgi:hypothetical protein